MQWLPLRSLPHTSHVVHQHHASPPAATLINTIWNSLGFLQLCRRKSGMQIGEEKIHGEEKENANAPLMALNHVSRVCRSVEKSVEFYTKVLGFVLIERPESFDFDGAWLFNYGVGIHLVQCKDEEKLPRDKDCLDPMDNHISFQCESMEEMEKKLKDMDVKYMKRTVGEEDGAPIDQLFFNDPDGFMVEICNCENLKLVPQRSIGKIKLPSGKHNPPLDLGDEGDDDVRPV